jgi:hypothetical protein
VAIARAVYATLAAPQQAARASSCGDRFLSPTRCSSDRHSLLGRVQSWVSIIRCWRRPSDRWRSFLASKSSQLDAQCASVGCMFECAAAARLHGERSHAEGPTSHEAMQLFRPALAREGVQPLIRMMVLQSSSLQNTVCFECTPLHFLKLSYLLLSIQRNYRFNPPFPEEGSLSSHFPAGNLPKSAPNDENPALPSSCLRAGPSECTATRKRTSKGLCESWDCREATISIPAGE